MGLPPSLTLVAVVPKRIMLRMVSTAGQTLTVKRRGRAVKRVRDLILAGTWLPFKAVQTRVFEKSVAQRQWGDPVVLYTYLKKTGS